MTPPPLWCRGHRGEAYDFDGYLEYVRRFHGHPAPGVVLGGAMVEGARVRLPEGCVFDAVCETRACLPDAIQLLTLCTIGNGWLRIIDSGRFALTLFDKASGQGVRVSLNPTSLPRYPHTQTWLFKSKPKPEQEAEGLLREIGDAGADLLKVQTVAVTPDLLTKAHLGPIGTCPGCGEPYPLRDGDSCRYCQGEKYFRWLPGMVLRLGGRPG